MTPTTIEDVLRKIGEVSGELGREGIAVPELGKTALALSEFRNLPEERIIVVPPAAPAFTLPPALQPLWDVFQAYFEAIHQQFGWANRDQWIFVALIAATLAIGGVPSSVTATWPTFLEYLEKLTTDLLGTLNADQYLTALDIAARLVSGAGGGGGGFPFPAPPATGGPFGWSSNTNSWVTVAAGLGEAPNTDDPAGYLRNGATGTWQLITVIDGGNYL